MRRARATFDCDGILAEFETRGFRLWRTYEDLIEEHANRGDLRLSERDPPNHRVQVFVDGVDRPLLGRDTRMWGAVEPASSAFPFADFRGRLEAAKKADGSFLTDIVEWEGTKKQAGEIYRRIASEIGLSPPTRSGSVLVFSLQMRLGELRLELDVGGHRRLAGNLPIYYYFRPFGRTEGGPAKAGAATHIPVAAAKLSRNGASHRQRDPGWLIPCRRTTCCKCGRRRRPPPWRAARR